MRISRCGLPPIHNKGLAFRNGGAAKKYGISKSTVHKDVSERLLKINPALASEVRVILDENKAERHIRGGQATKLKYRNEHIRKEAI